MNEEPQKTMETLSKDFQEEAQKSRDKVKEFTNTPLPKPIQVMTDQRGVLMASNIDEQFRMATAFYKSGLMPQALNSPEKVLVALQLCYELGLKPMTSISKICVINGAPNIFGDLPLALVKNSGKLAHIEEWFFDKEGKKICEANKNIFSEVYGAACETVRKEGLDTRTTYWTVDDAKTAKVWGTKVWAVYPKRMLQLRARSHNLKDNFPDVLMGVQIAEYDNNVDPSNSNGAAIDVTPPDAASNLNSNIQKDDRMAGKEENDLLAKTLTSRGAQGWNIDNYRSYIKAKYNADLLIQLTKEQAQGLVKVMEAMTYHDAIAAVKFQESEN